MMHIDGAAIYEFLQDRKLEHKSLFLFSRSEIELLASKIIECCDGGYGVPVITEAGELIIPADAPHKYRWWQGGQSIIETLRELGADDKIIEKYRPLSRSELCAKDSDFTSTDHRPRQAENG